MAREIDQEEVSMDFTPMIDVVFLLIIFFILMPMKEMEGQLQAYLPESPGESKEDPVEQEMWNLDIISKAVNAEEINTKILFQNFPVGEFTTYSAATMDAIYKMKDRGQKNERLKKEHQNDKSAFSPTSKTFKNLHKRMMDAANSAPEGKKTPVMISASPEAPFKIVLAVLNSGAGNGFSEMKFVAPNLKKIMQGSKQ